MLHKFSTWSHLWNFDQSEHKNWTKSVTNAWSWRAKSKATVFPACNGWLNFRLRGHDIHEIHDIFYVNFQKMKLEPAIILKLVTFQGITSKNTWPWWVDTWACDTVKWYWAADTLFWQLSIDHNIVVQYVCIISFPVLSNYSSWKVWDWTLISI